MADPCDIYISVEKMICYKNARIACALIKFKTLPDSRRGAFADGICMQMCFVIIFSFVHVLPHRLLPRLTVTVRFLFCIYFCASSSCYCEAFAAYLLKAFTIISHFKCKIKCKSIYQRKRKNRIGEKMKIILKTS